MISYQDALQIIFKNSSQSKTEKLPLLSALSKISASDLTSNMQVPSFRNSAMDGFAIKCSDIKNASTENPVKLNILQAIAAGDKVEISAATATTNSVQIMTGAPVPEVFDAVIPVEEVIIENNSVIFKRPAKLNENIRFPGEDVRIGQNILSKGKKITSEDIMLLSALGVNEVSIYKFPSIQILSTGKEITDNYNEPLPEGKIYNSNSPYLIAKAREEGFEAVYGGIIADDPKEFESVISKVKPETIIITTGAVSKGEWDFVPESLRNLGVEIHFHRVNIRPGKPVLFAILPNGSYFFGLPGNPISATIGFRFFIMPLLRILQGLEPEQPLIAQLSNNFTKKGNFRQFLKSNLETDSNGQLVVSISSGQESFKISPMAESNAWVILEEDQNEYRSGSLVSVLPYKTLNQLPIKLTEKVSCKVA
jgi:molybdopterin molybdotransferase